MSDKRIVVETEERACHCSDPDYCTATRTVRRTLTPGNSYVRYMGDWDEWKPIYDQLPVVTRAALAHLHGRHDEPTMYCPLCGFDPDADHTEGET